MASRLPTLPLSPLRPQHLHRLRVGIRPRPSLGRRPDDSLDARRWILVLRSSGFSRVIITAKHHDGFCLWPSEYTEYSVTSSPWRRGKGDVVGELERMARVEGMDLGIYLSPWDRHEESYGRTREYKKSYMGQMRELLTRYGEMTEVFLDGAPEKDKTNTKYLFDSWFGLIRQLQHGQSSFQTLVPTPGGLGTRLVLLVRPAGL